MLPGEDGNFTLVPNPLLDRLMKAAGRGGIVDRDAVVEAYVRRHVGRRDRANYREGEVQGLTLSVVEGMLGCSCGRASETVKEVIARLGGRRIGDGNFTFVSGTPSGTQSGTTVGTSKNKTAKDVISSTGTPSGTASGTASGTQMGFKPSSPLGFEPPQDVAISWAPEAPKTLAKEESNAMQCVAAPSASGEQGLRDKCVKQNNALQAFGQEEPGLQDATEGPNTPGYTPPVPVPSIQNNAGQTAILQAFGQEEFQEIPLGLSFTHHPVGILDPDTCLIITYPNDTSCSEPPTLRIDPAVSDTNKNNLAPSAAEVCVSPFCTIPPAPDSAPAMASKTGGNPPQPPMRTPDESPAHSAALATMNLYNSTAAVALPRVFQAVDLTSEDGHHTIKGLEELFAISPDRIEDIQAIVQVLAVDKFLQGANKNGTTWTLRVLAGIRKPDVLERQGARARNFLESLSQDGSRPAQSTTAPATQSLVPNHRREHGTAGEAQLAAIFEDMK